MICVLANFAWGGRFGRSEAYPIFHGRLQYNLGPFMAAFASTLTSETLSFEWMLGYALAGVFLSGYFLFL